MKGTIFVELMKSIESEHGLDMVDAVIERAGDKLESQGAYTTVGNYAHQELLSLIEAISEITHTSAPTLLEGFAGHIVGVFRQMHPEFFDEAADYLGFLESIESRIHAEVFKLYPEANPPKLTTERIDDHSLTIHYRSHRPLAPFAACLARQSAPHFNTKVDVKTISESDDGQRAEISVRVEK